MQPFNFFQRFVLFLKRRIKTIAFFLICSALCATAYLYFLPPQYQSQSLIKIETINPLQDNRQTAASPKGITEADVIKSKNVVMSAISFNGLNVDYIRSKNLQQKQIFFSSPVSVNSKISDASFISQHYSISFPSANSYSIRFKVNQETIERQGEFGKELNTGQVTLTISKSKSFGEAGDAEFSFTVYSPSAMADKMLKENISVCPANQESNVVQITVEHPVPEKSFLLANALAYAYSNEESYANQKYLSENVKIIDKQLENVSHQLNEAQKAADDFKKENNIVDIPQESQSSLNTISQLEVEKVKLNMQMAALENLSEYMRKNRKMDNIAPEFGTIEDPVFASIINRLNEKITERSSLVVASGEADPSKIQVVSQEIESLKDYLAESIRNTRKKTAIKEEEINNAIASNSYKAEQLPAKASELQALNRKVYMHDKVFNYLVEKRATALVTLPSSISAGRILSSASFPMAPVAPIPYIVYSIAIICGFLLSMIYTSIRNSSKFHISNREELQRFTSIPFIGNISRLSKNTNYSEEAFMNLCTRMMLLFQNKSFKMITVTSTAKGEGKTFVASNLAKSLGMLDKKVLVVDMNMNEPQMETLFNIQNEVTMSDVYSNQSITRSAITSTENPNIDVLTAGRLKAGINTILSSPKTGNIIDELKGSYDVIIFDTPDSVNHIDAIPMMKMSDLNLYVVKANATSQAMVTNAELIRNDYEVDNMYFLLNAVTENQNYSGFVAKEGARVISLNRATEEKMPFMKRAAFWFY